MAKKDRWFVCTNNPLEFEILKEEVCEVEIYIDAKELEFTCKYHQESEQVKKVFKRTDLHL